MATDGSAPRVGTGWLARNTRDAGSAVDRVVATNGAGPLVDVYSTDLSGAYPVVLAVESGTVSEPRVDGNTVTWSVDRWDGVRTGTVYVHNVPRGRTTSF